MDIDKMILKLKAKEFSYWEEAEAFKEILDTDMRQESLARLLGMKQTTISNKIRLLKLLPEVRFAIEKYALSERHARALLKVNDYRLQIKMIEHIHKYELTVNETEIFIEKQLRQCVNTGNINEFVQMITNGIKSLKLQGVKIKGGKKDKGEYTDIVVRVYK